MPKFQYAIVKWNGIVCGIFLSRLDAQVFAETIHSGKVEVHTVESDTNPFNTEFTYV